MRNIRVLIVDDEVAFTRNLSLLLSRRGCDVKTINDGLSATLAVEDEQFDVVLLDLRMPGIDGIETLKRIKRKQPHLEVIILTGHGSVDTAIEGVGHGAFDYAMKPFDITELVERITKAFQRKLLREQQTDLKA
ncbi:MAG: response regulator [Syntrophobacteraceae bacterium]